MLRKTWRKASNADNRKKLSIFIFTMILGLFAYGYAFVNFVPAHDGIMTVTHDQSWQTALGRGLMQVYVQLRGTVNAPWLIGMLTLIYTAVAVYLTDVLLGISEELWKEFIISSVYVLNISYICSAAVYIYLLDIYAMALLLAVLAVYLFEKIPNIIVGIVLSSIVLSLSMGLYQSYFAVAIALFIISFIKRTVTEKYKISDMLIYALQELGTVVIGAGLYAGTMKLIQFITHVEPYDSYNSVTNLSKLSLRSILELIPECYKSFFSFFFRSQQYSNKLFTVINVFLLVIAIVAYIYIIIHMNSIGNRIILLLAIAIFPLGANCIYILSSGMIHYLMVYSYQMFYILLLMPILRGSFHLGSFKIGGGYWKPLDYWGYSCFITCDNKIFK